MKTIIVDADRAQDAKFGGGGNFFFFFYLGGQFLIMEAVGKKL